MTLDALPTDLPRPEDDGACDHLPGMAVPSIALPSTAGRDVDLAHPHAPRTVVYVYPMTGRPDRPLPEGWEMIPGARGCTPEACSFRDHHRELAELSAAVFGLSTQATDYQREMVERLHLPFEVLSDREFRVAGALRLPTFETDGMVLIKRLTLVIRNGGIERVFYPVFPPDRHAEEVVDWLAAHRL